MEPERKRSVIIAILVGVVFVAAVLYLVHWQSLSAKITVVAVPSKSTVTINGNHGRNGLNRVKPGQYTVFVSMEGFTSVTQKVSVKKGDNKTLDFVLTPNSAATANWYTTHKEDEQKAEGISSRNNDKITKESVKNAPLIQLLPFVGGGLEFRVDYGNPPGSQASQPVIYITAPTEQGQQDGVAWIRSIGYDPSDYNIKFVTGTVQPLD